MANSFFKNTFLPHEENDYQPHVLRGKTAVILVALVVLAQGLFFAEQDLATQKSHLFALILPGVLVEQTNDRRADNDLATLTVNPLLEAAAAAKAQDMVTNGYFAHNSPSGFAPWHWMDQVGYRYVYAGENLAVNFVDSSDVTNAWMASPSHRENLLSDNFTEIGIATAKGTYKGKEAVFVVQMFGRPAGGFSFAPPPPTALAETVAPPVIEEPTPAPPPAPAPPQRPATQPKPVAAQTTVRPDSEELFIAVENEDVAASEAAAADQAPVAGSSLSAGALSLSDKIIASPKRTMYGFYALLAAIIAIGLFLKLSVNSHMKHPRLILNGLVMLLIIGGVVLYTQYATLAEAIVW